MIPVTEPDQEVNGMPLVPGVWTSEPLLSTMIRSPRLVMLSCVRWLLRWPWHWLLH